MDELFDSINIVEEDKREVQQKQEEEKKEETTPRQKPPFFLFLDHYATYVSILLLTLITTIAVYLRTRPLSNLIDITTGNYIPSDPDAIGIFRYVQYAIEHGQLMSIDYMRYYPLGFSGVEEFAFLAHTIAWFYKILHFFSASITPAYADIMYPVFAFVLALILFFLLIKKIFTWKIAILASFFLSIITHLLSKTIAGYSDKEALALVFYFLTLYLFILFFLEKKYWKALVFILLTSLSGTCLWFTSGTFTFIFLIIGLFMFLMILLEQISIRKIYLASIFLIIPLLSIYLFYPTRFNLIGLLMTPAFGLIFFTIIYGIFHHFFLIKDPIKIRTKIGIPPSFASLFLTIVLLLFSFILFKGFHSLPGLIQSLLSSFISPITKVTFTQTVTENASLYVINILDQYGFIFFISILGLIFLFYNTFKILNRKDLIVYTSTFIISLSSFFLSRFSAQSILNGSSSISLVLFSSSFLIFILATGYILIVSYKKDQKLYSNMLTKIQPLFLFVLVIYFFFLLAATSALRFGFLFGPLFAISLSYFFYISTKFALSKKDHVFRYGLLLLLFFLIYFTAYEFIETSLDYANNEQPDFTPQWQSAMAWIRENTQKNAVFAQWWDYGYYIQTFGERATLSDGGNADPTINYLIAHDWLTNVDNDIVLASLANRNASHILISAEEIGKYFSFSAIASNINESLLTALGIFSLDETQSISSPENGTLIYIGSTILQEDLLHEGIFLPSDATQIIGFTITYQKNEEGIVKEFTQANAVLLYNQELYFIPLECVVYEKQITSFENASLDACLVLIEEIKKTTQGYTEDPIAAAIYVPPRAKNSWFARYYLYREENNAFSLVYNDGTPIYLYQNKLNGPIMIWEIQYPENIPSISEKQAQ